MIITISLCRCSNEASIQSHKAEIKSEFLTPGSSQHIALHADTLYEVPNQLHHIFELLSSPVCQIQNLIDFGDNPRACFDNAQKEAVATLKLLVYRTYMRERHAMMYDTTEKPPPIDETSELIDSPL